MYPLVSSVNASLWEALGGRDISKGWEDRIIEYGKDGFIEYEKVSLIEYEKERFIEYKKNEGPEMD